MPDLEKVIKGLELCLGSIDSAGCPEECPYYEACQKYENYAVFQPLMRDALEALKAQEPKWISVKDRLPDAAGYECLVCAVNENYNQTHVFTAHTGYGEPGWWTGNVHYMSRITSPSDNRLHPALNVTHWMPLPEPPKEES